MGIPLAHQKFGEWFSHGHELGAFGGDSKSAADAVPLFPLKDINAEYEVQRQLPNFNLSMFLAQRFMLPQYAEQEFIERPGKDVAAHIDSLWGRLTMEPSEDEHTRIGLRFNHIVPGERYSDAYYWDGYFVMVCFVKMGRIKEATDMLNNYTDMIKRFGRIPNGSRTYYLSRSHPPMYSQMVRLLSDHHRSTEQDPRSVDPLVTYLPAMVKEWEYWNKGRTLLGATDAGALHQVVSLPGAGIVNRYRDTQYTPRDESYREDVITAKNAAARFDRSPEDVHNGLRGGAASGHDFSSRWLADGESLETIHTSDILPIDLNCLLYMQEKTIAEAYELKLMQPNLLPSARDRCVMQAKFFHEVADHRAKIINECFWDEKAGTYRDIDFTGPGGPKQTPINSMVAIFALFAGIAPMDRAKRVVEKLEAEFLKLGGLITTDHDSEHQWNKMGWAPMHRIAIMAAEKYGFSDFANKIRCRFLGANILLFENRGCLFEKVDVENIAPGHGGAEYACVRDIAWAAAEVELSLVEIQDQYFRQHGVTMPKELLRGAVLLAT